MVEQSPKLLVSEDKATQTRVSRDTLVANQSSKSNPIAPAYQSLSIRNWVS